MSILDSANKAKYNARVKKTVALKRLKLKIETLMFKHRVTNDMLAETLGMHKTQFSRFMHKDHIGVRTDRLLQLEDWVAKMKLK